MDIMEQYIPVGKTGKTHGTEGELKFFIEENLLDDFLEAPAIFLSVGGKPAPFFIESARGENTLIVKLEEVDTREAAQPLAGVEVLLRKEDITADATGPMPDFSFLEGFTITDRKAGEIGRIEEVAEFPQQLMAILTYKGKEILIPLNDAFILHIDEEARRIAMDLPEGLLEL